MLGAEEQLRDLTTMAERLLYRSGKDVRESDKALHKVWALTP